MLCVCDIYRNITDIDFLYSSFKKSLWFVCHQRSQGSQFQTLFHIKIKACFFHQIFITQGTCISKYTELYTVTQPLETLLLHAEF